MAFQIHTSGTPTSPWGTSRKNYYNVTGIPDVWVDGALEQYGAYSTDQLNYDNMESLMNQRLAVPTDLLIELYGEASRGQYYEFTGVLRVDPGGEAKTVRVHLVEARNNYPENDDGRYNNGVVQGADLGEFTINPGQEITITHQMTLVTDPYGPDAEDIRMFMFAHDPLASGPAEVHQATMTQYPFRPYLPCPGDLTDDELVNIDDIFNLLGLWGDCPDPCPPYCTGDLTEDCTVNIDDIFAILGYWGNCPAEPMGACCYWDGTCTDATRYDCVVQGNSVWYEGEECATYDCILPTGACCIGTDCIETNTEYECFLADGLWYEGEDCDTYVCELVYCDAGGGCDEYISNITCGDINNTTGCDQYGDYTHLSTDMIIGSGYTFTLTIGNPYTADQGGLWIDWNQDGDFEDADETITVAWTGTGPYTTTITPPAGAEFGPTRLRTRLTWSATPTACGHHTYGEVEDYTVNVIAPFKR